MYNLHFKCKVYSLDQVALNFKITTKLFIWVFNSKLCDCIFYNVHKSCNAHGQSISYDCWPKSQLFPPFSFLHISTSSSIHVTIGICLNYPTRLVPYPSMLAWMYTWYVYIYHHKMPWYQIVLDAHHIS